MSFRVRFVPHLFALLSVASMSLAQDVELGKIVSDANKSTPPAEGVPQVNPAPAQPAAPSPGTALNPADKAMADAILADCTDIAQATNLWAQEKKKAGRSPVTLRDISPYLKPDSPVITAGGNDRLGNPYNFGTAEAGPFVSATTMKTLGTTPEFWGDYAPMASKQDLAAATLADMKQIRLAILKRDADGEGKPNEKITFEMLQGYLPEDSEAWKLEGADRLGNDYALGTVKDPIHLSTESFKEFALGKDYWGEFAPKSGQTASRSSSGSGSSTRRRTTQPQSSGFGRKVKNFFLGR
jgi:hypothetical protein